MQFFGSQAATEVHQVLSESQEATIGTDIGMRSKKITKIGQIIEAEFSDGFHQIETKLMTECSIIRRFLSGLSLKA